MAKISYTPLAAKELDGDDKREARVHLHRDGSLQGWCVTSSEKSVLWRVRGEETIVGLANEARNL
jgi:hypothetical protein